MSFFVNNDLASGLQERNQQEKASTVSLRPPINLEQIGSTGKGFGHLSDAQAIRKSPVPKRDQRHPILG